jgi:hypothetical protein
MTHPFLVQTPEPRYFEADHCANCLAPLPEDVTGLWCSTWCTDVNAKVRYWRAVQRDGRIDDPDIQFQIQMNVAFLLIGGYRALGRRPSAETRKKVVERDGGRCQSCGKPGSDLDHIDGNSDDPSNLQMLCGPCHRAKTAESLRPADDESRALILALNLGRVIPDEPQLLADDENAWAGLWHELKRERKVRFEESLLAVGYRVPRRHLSRLQLVAARDAYVAAQSRPVLRLGSHGSGRETS